jgi:arylsulfatase A-like enzyme
MLALCFGPAILYSQAQVRPPVWPVVKAGPASLPNVILITLDTVRADHMGIYGYAANNTPHLQTFLKESTLYTNFIAASPWTLPSHASIFTGLYVQSHGAIFAVDHVRPLARNIPTLAQVLATNGYRTMAVVANRYFLRTEFGVLRGFQFTDWRSPTMLISVEREYLLRNRLRSLLSMGGLPRDLDMQTMPAEEVNKSSRALLDQARKQAAPFFLFLNYTDAHVPYVPPPPFRDLYPGRDPGYSAIDYDRTYTSVNAHNLRIGSRAREHMVSQYDGAIAYLDYKIGELLAYLKANGQFDRTLIIVTSDHGEALGDRNLVGHASSVYQDQVHVPLIVKYPGEAHPGRIDALASHVDLMPTVLDVVQVAAPAGMEGISLRQIGSLPDRPVVAEKDGGGLLLKKALYYGSRKLIYAKGAQPELYDLAADPAENHNLATAPGTPETLAMRAQLMHWSSQTTPRYLQAGDMDRDAIKRLKSLGYANHGEN